MRLSTWWTNDSKLVASGASLPASSTLLLSYTCRHVHPPTTSTLPTLESSTHVVQALTRSPRPTRNERERERPRESLLVEIGRLLHCICICFLSYTGCDFSGLRVFTLNLLE